MDDDFEPDPRRCGDLVCRRSNLCRRRCASACLTSPRNARVRWRRIAETLRQVLRDSGTDTDGPPPPDALPIEETLKIIREEVQKRQAQKRQAHKRQTQKHRSAEGHRTVNRQVPASLKSASGS